MTDQTSEEQFAAVQDTLAGRWSLERELGRGGMGTVYLARDVTLDRPVALKVLHPDLAMVPRERERFLSEARTGAGLSHPNIVPIYDVEEAGNLVYFVMGMVDGESLGHRIRREGPLPAEEVERILGEIGWAMAAAHANRILHRDITLDNILLERNTGRALLADFGIASRIDGGNAGPLVGTAEYLAPELIQGEPASPASDLYALGVVGWAALTGHLPFLDEDPEKILIRQVTEPIPPLRDSAPGTPSRLAGKIESLLAKDPAARPIDVESWLASLEQRTKLPAIAQPLRRWAQGRDHVRPFQALAMTTIGVLGAMWTGAIGGVSSLLSGTAILLLAVGGTLGVIHLGMAIRALRRAAADGFGLEDLRLALDRNIADARRLKQPEPGLAAKIVHRITVWSAIFLVISLLPRLLSEWRLLRWHRGMSVLLMAFLYYGESVLAWSWVALWTSMGVNILLPHKIRPAIDLRTKLRRAFWHGPLAPTWLKVATLFNRDSAVAPSTLHRPTELVIGLEIEDLWDELPEVARHDLAELPATARSLRQGVEQLRNLIAEVDHSDRPPTDDDIAIRRNLVARRTAALGSLERLRLLVLRLVGVAELPGDLTQQLQQAREFESELLAEFGADPGVARLVGSGGLTPA